MIYALGGSADYDTWGDLVDPIWSWSNVEPIFKRVFDKLNPFSYQTFVAGYEALKDASATLNCGPGFKDHFLTIDKKQQTRFSMADAYIAPILTRSNLCVLLKNEVISIEIQGGNKAEGVWALDRLGNKRYITANKEVIVSGGAINSPKLLMRSGIGPANHLTNKYINVVKDLPQVGMNMEDHVVVPFYFSITDIPMIPLSLMTTVYCATKQLMNNIEMASFLGFFNTIDCSNPQPDIEIIPFEFLQCDNYYLELYIEKFNIAPQYAQKLRDYNQKSAILLLLVTLQHPESTGTVTLNSNKHDDPPLIDPKYFSKQNDVDAIIRGFKQIIKPMLDAPVFKGHGSKLLPMNPAGVCPGGDTFSDDYLKCYMKQLGGTIYHPAGTCRMGKDEANSVVDKEGKVWGIEKLRVIDSSIIPYLISGHLNIPTCMLAELLADIILKV